MWYTYTLINRYIGMMALTRNTVILLLANTILVLFGATATLLKSFEIEELVPHVVPKAPAGLVSVKYSSGVEVQEGNELTPTQVKDIPTVSWQFNPESFYTLVMTDPSPLQYNEWQHWLVGNIPGGNVAAGETLSAYIGSGPPKGTGFHRYVFLVYKQPGKISFKEPLLNDSSTEHRGSFSVAKFAEKYELGNPIAGNFYMCQYDPYVPILYKQIGI